MKRIRATRPIRARDIDDRLFLGAVTEAIRVRSELDRLPYKWATRWDVAAVLAGHSEWVGRPGATSLALHELMPQDLVLAKAQSLQDRGFMHACLDGCRGDFFLTPTPDRTDIPHA